jgi:hypothetical protein
LDRGQQLREERVRLHSRTAWPPSTASQSPPRRPRRRPRQQGMRLRIAACCALLSSLRVACCVLHPVRCACASSVSRGGAQPDACSRSGARHAGGAAA